MSHLNVDCSSHCLGIVLFCILGFLSLMFALLGQGDADNCLPQLLLLGLM